MLKRAFILCLFVLIALISVFACGGDTQDQGAIVAIISTDLTTADFDSFRIEVSQETSPGTYGPPLVAKDFPFAASNAMPATFTISSGKAADQNALVRVIATKGGAPVVLREIEVRVPTDKVLALPMVLSRACAGQVKTDSTGRVVTTCPNAHESCQPSTGACGSSVVDPSTLAPYSGAGASSGGPGGGDASAPLGPDEKEIESFILAGVTGTISGSDIFLSLPPNAQAGKLVPTIGYRAARIDPDPTAAQDFDNVVQYTLTAQNGSTRVYNVHTQVATSSSHEIVSYNVTGATTLYEYLQGYEITLEVTAGFDVKHVKPTIAFVGQSIKPASLEEVDLTNPVVYTVTAYDGTSRDYKVDVEVEDADTAEITSFKLNGVAGDILGDDITVPLPGGTDVSHLVPEIQFLGGSINPPANVAQDFTNPVKYTVTAADGTTTADYTVTVKHAVVSVVEMSPAGGSYFGPLGVKLTCRTQGATIHYTTDGSDPTDTSPTYAAPIQLTAPATKPIKARCYAANYDPQLQANFGVYTVNSFPFNAQPEIVFGPTICGTTASPQTFTLSNTSGAAADYTTAAHAGGALQSFSVSPQSGSLPTSGATITVTPKQVPVKPDTTDDIVEVVDFTFTASGAFRSVTLRQLVTCPN